MIKFKQLWKGFTSTWCEGKATTWDINTAGKKSTRCGLRISIMDWANGKFEVRVIKGDGRTYDFKTFYADFIMNASEQQKDALIARAFEVMNQVNGGK